MIIRPGPVVDFLLANQNARNPHSLDWRTVIDNKVCHPKNNDFYLCAHAGMIVVSSREWPLISRYRAAVRTQSPKLEMIDSLFKPSGMVDEVAPICYAHLAASQLGQFMKFEDASETSSSHGGVTAPGAIAVPQLSQIE
ncbi:hypothetical protein V6N12_030614 [Hibiscus sabdariffa]|uniref:Uncharacterized protein n=1 Tax=Hibiscus sabdariffa TaxID=183260 RepID=A0ABR2A3Y1_9ROSI